VFKRILFVLIIMASISMTSCKSGGGRGASSSSPTGRMKVLLTDAPFPTSSVAAIYVTVNAIEARRYWSGSYTTILSVPTTLDILQFRNGVTAVVAEVDVSPTDYDAIRVTLGSVEVDLVDGRTFVVGQGTQVIAALGPNVSVAAGLTSTVVLDFDVAQSLIPTGNSLTTSGITGFTFNPMIRAADIDATGTLSGTIRSDNETLNTTADDSVVYGAKVSIIRNGAVVATALSDNLGFYKVLGLPSGLYDIRVERRGHFEEYIRESWVLGYGGNSQVDATLEKMPSWWPNF
jgi:hypothetical protein